MMQNRGMNLRSLVLLLTVLFPGATAWSQTASIEQIHGDTCWVGRSGDSIRVASFNDRQAELWNSVALEEEVRKILLASEITTEGEVTVSLSCSNLGHNIIVRGSTDQGLRFCLYTDMKFSSFEVYGDQKNQPECWPYILGELLIYEPDEELRGQALKVLTQMKYRKDIAGISAEGSVITLHLRPNLRFAEAHLLEILRKDTDLPEGLVIMLNEVVGYSAAQTLLMRWKASVL